MSKTVLAMEPVATRNSMDCGEMEISRILSDANLHRRRMKRRLVVLLVGVLAAASLGLQGPAGAAPLRARTAAEAAAAFKSDQAGWVVADEGYGGLAAGIWTYALGGEAGWSNYGAECRVHLAKPATQRDGIELQHNVVFSNHANLGGYEAGLVLRHQSPQKHYRVAVSSLWKEVVLWRPSGGVVQAVEFPFETGKTYHLTAQCRGPRISVQVDGKPLIDWWDTVDPVESGKAGLARKEGESYFTAVRVDPLGALNEKPPAHVARFRERRWHDQQFFFDGDEPIFVYWQHGLDLMKFRPGYRPVLGVYHFASDGAALSLEPRRYALVQDGEQVVLELTGGDRKKKSPVTGDVRYVVRYDPAANVYIYDHTCTAHIPEEVSGKVGAVWDFGNPLPLGIVGRADTRNPKAPRTTYDWFVRQGDDGKFYKVPLNHNNYYDGAAETSGGPVKAGGFGWVAVGDPVLSPTVRMPERSANIDKNGFATCWWAYDVHVGFYPKLVSGDGPKSHGLIEWFGRGGFYPPAVHGTVLPGDYRTRLIYSAISASEGRDILAKAEFYKPVDLGVKIPVYTAGVGFREPFDKVVLLASPHTEHRIWAGVIDEQVGHDGPGSLRLDGPTDAYTQTGSSYFMNGYPKKVRVSGWVKTRNVQGEGPAVGFRRFGNRTSFEFHNTGVTGTTDWTPFSYVTGFPANCFGVTLYWRNSGTGTAWFDDFQIEPVDDAAEATARNYPREPADPDIVLRWDGRGDARGVLDASGYGSHGKFYDQAAWAEENGKRVIELRGPSAYVWPLSSPNLTFAQPVSVVVRLKPEAPGNLLFWDFNFLVTGTGPKFGIGYQENTLFGKPRGLSDPMVASKPFLEAGKWQTLAIVAADDQIKLYCEGKLVESLAAAVKGGNWGPMAMDDHQGVHRRLSFFGSGPGDALVLASDEVPSTGGGFKGRVSRLVVYRRALGEQEIGKLSSEQLRY